MARARGDRLRDRNPSISSLRHRVEVQELTKTSDGAGGYSESWVTSHTLWAKVDPVGAFEKVLSQQIQHAVTHKITLRKVDGLTTKSRLLFGSRVFRVLGVRNLEERNQFLLLDCEERSV